LSERRVAIDLPVYLGDFTSHFLLTLMKHICERQYEGIFDYGLEQQLPALSNTNKSFFSFSPSNSFAILLHNDIVFSGHADRNQQGALNT
jgi:hypothetical protein